MNEETFRGICCVAMTVVMLCIFSACISYVNTNTNARVNDDARILMEMKKFKAWEEDRARALDRIAKQEAKMKAEEEAKWAEREDRIRRFKERNEGVK